MQPVVIRDSTLREGIEFPGVELSLKDKFEIARFLDKIGAPEIEIGMPYGIKGCLPLAALVKSRGLKIKTSALILSYRPSWKEEIKTAAGSAISRIEILIPTSDILLSLKDYYKIQKNSIPDLLKQTLSYAKGYFPQVGLGFVDATRTDPDFLIQLARLAQRAGADRAIIYDTIGIATPLKMARLIKGIRKNNSIQIIAHCHNDFGLATANSLASIEAGADGTDVVVNGLGDRGGNAPFEEVVLALERLYGTSAGINLKKITELSSLVEEKTGMRKCRVKPIVGEFTFLHSPVMHIRNAASGNYGGFEPFSPELIGSARKYAFSLGVDYAEALEPFYKKLRLKPRDKEKALVMRMLKQKSRNRGLSDKEVCAIIKKIIKPAS